jgi:DNA-binding response OmpR family regulator
VLEVLMGGAGEVVTRTELVDRCWDERSEPLSNVVDVLIGQLRRRLGSAEAIETVRGVGYRLCVSPGP